MSWIEEFRRSLKAPEAEDKIDLFFYRPLGFAVAKAGGRAGLSPTHLTLLGAIAGLLAGALFYTGPGPAVLGASGLLLLSGILDSADGQLARLSGRSTPFGRVLDGICDNVVFSAVYIGCTLPLMGKIGWWAWPLAIFAGVSHSMQSSLLDFYNREYLYYAGPASPADWNQLVTQARRNDGWWEKLHCTWLRQQALFCTRSTAVRLAMHEARKRYPNFSGAYRRHNLGLLHLWRPLGANVHTFAIIAFAYLARFELYLILIDIAFLNVWLLFAWSAQRAADQDLLLETGISLS